MPGNKRSAPSGVRHFATAPLLRAKNAIPLQRIDGWHERNLPRIGFSARTAATTCSFSSGSNEQVE